MTWNLALAYRGRGSYVAAIEHFRQYLRAPEAAAPPERLAAIREEIAELDGRLVRVTASGAPPGARLQVDGEARALPPPGEPLVLDPGRHVLEWSAEGHRPARCEVPDGATAFPCAVTLEPLREGRLVVEPAPPGASVRVDGRPLGAGRQELRLDPGEHHVDLAAPGHLPVHRAVRVGPTGVVRLTVLLERTRTPGWVLPAVIVGLSVTAIAATVTGVLLALPDVPPPHRGTWGNVSEPPGS